MNFEKLFLISKVAGLCLVSAVVAWFLPAHAASQSVVAEWRTAWVVLVSVCTAGLVLPLALVHAGLAAWADDAVEQLDAVLGRARR